MKKLYNEFIKNIKIMFRNWTTISLLVVAPLLLILLIGYSFGNENFSGIKIGFIDKTIDDNYNKYINRINNSEYSDELDNFNIEKNIENFREKIKPLSENLSTFGDIIIYPIITNCVLDMKENKIHLCIILEGIDFNQINNSENSAEHTDIKTGKVTYYYDNTRKKISTALIQELQKFFGLKSEEIGIEASEGIIENIQELISFIGERKNDITKIKNESQSIKNDLIERKEQLILAREEFLPSYNIIKKLQIEINNYSGSINNLSENIIGSINKKSEDLISELNNFIILSEFKKNEFFNEVTNIINYSFEFNKSNINTINNETTDILKALYVLRGNLSELFENNSINYSEYFNYSILNYSINSSELLKYDYLLENFKNLSEEEKLNKTKEIDVLFNKLNSTKKYEVSLENTTNELISEIISINTLIQETNFKINNVIEKIDLIKKILDQEINRSDEYIHRIDLGVQEITKLENELDIKLSSMTGLDKDLGEKLIRPITYAYETVIKDSKNIQISFPFLCVMIIMFISLLFSNISTLIEINDKSYLRNIVSPVKNRVYFFGMFFTSTLIVFFQIMILFFVAQHRFNVNVFSVFPKLMFITLIIISVFILIGMCFSYLSKSTQSSILITTFFALILFIFANTIAPLETMPEIARNIVKYNPLIIGEYLIKSVQLFDFPLILLSREIITLTSYILILTLLGLYLSYKKSKNRD